MKKSIYALAFFVLAFSLNSCDWFDEAASPDFSFNTDLSVDLDVETDESEINTEIVLDPLENQEIERYQKEIKGLEIKSLGYRVTEFNSEALVFSGTLEYSIGTASPKLLTSLEGVDVKALFESGDEKAFDIPTAELEEIAATLEAKNKVTLYLSGNLEDGSGKPNAVPANFTLELIAHLKVTTEVEL